MGQNIPPSPPDPHALLALAKAGGPQAVLAAKRAAVLTERDDPALAREALAIVAKLEPADPAPKLALARLHAENGDLAAARAEARAVFADSSDPRARARAAFMLGEMARVEGDAAAARDAYATTLRIEDKLLTDDRTDVTAARWFARARGRIAELDAHGGEFARARAGAEGALALLRAAAAHVGETPVLAADIADAEMRLGALELDANQPASATRRLREAIGRYEALAVTEKDEPHWRAVLSDAWALMAEAELAREDPQRARAAMDKALQARVRLAASNPQEAWALAGVWRVRAALLETLQDHAAAADSLMQARAIVESLLKQTPDAEAPARFWAHTLLDQADLALRFKDPAGARDAADAARAGCERFAQKPGAHPAWFGDIGACWDRLGEAARLARAPAQAQGAFARAVEFRRMARDRAPDNARFVRGLAAALVKLGEAELETSANASARAAFHESVALRLALVEQAPHDTRAAHALAAALERLGIAARACGDIPAARGAWEDELTLADRIFAHDDIDGLRFCAIVESHLAALGGADGEHYRVSALSKFDELAKAGAMTTAEAELRKKLWGG